MTLRGRVHLFDDDINTDYIIADQHKSRSTDMREIATHAFADIRPDFVGKVRAGDLVVAGRNFGCGSAREAAPHVLKILGISCLIAKSFARIFFRNAINIGMPLAECDTSPIQEGDDVEVDLEHGMLRDLTQGIAIDTAPLPPVMRAILQAGGIDRYLAVHGDLVLPR